MVEVVQKIWQHCSKCFFKNINSVISINFDSHKAERGLLARLNYEAVILDGKS